MRVRFEAHTHFIDCFLKHKRKVRKLQALFHYNSSKIGVAVADIFNHGTSFRSVTIPLKLSLPLRFTSSYYDCRYPSRGEQKFRDFMTSS
jgi:hypothetical protein